MWFILILRVIFKILVESIKILVDGFLKEEKVVILEILRFDIDFLYGKGNIFVFGNMMLKRVD